MSWKSIRIANFDKEAIDLNAAGQFAQFLKHHLDVNNLFPTEVALTTGTLGVAALTEKIQKMRGKGQTVPAKATPEAPAAASGTSQLPAPKAHVDKKNPKHEHGKEGESKAEKKEIEELKAEDKAESGRTN